jgi:hypothetical protein
MDSKKDKKDFCSECVESELAVSKCLDCNDFLCQLHSIHHTKSRKTHNHIIKALKIKDDEKFSYPTLDQITVNANCKVHAMELVLFCFKCKEPICRDCGLTTHKIHDYKFLTEVIQEEKEVLKGHISTLENIKNAHFELNKDANQYRKNLFECKQNIIVQINNIIVSLQDIIVSFESNLRSKLDDLYNDLKKIPDYMEMESEKIIKDINITLSTMKLVLTDSSDLNIKNRNDEFNIQVNEIKKLLFSELFSFKNSDFQISFKEDSNISKQKEDFAQILKSLGYLTTP